MFSNDDSNALDISYTWANPLQAPGSFDSSQQSVELLSSIQLQPTGDPARNTPEEELSKAQFFHNLGRILFLFSASPILALYDFKYISIPG